jgi:hypothetical protein
MGGSSFPLSLVPKFTPLYERSILVELGVYLTALIAARAKGIESSFIKSSKKPVFKGLVLDRQRRHIQIKHRSIDGQLFTTLANHLLIGTCDLASVASPQASSSATTATAKPVAPPRPVTAEEIIAALPPEGISIGNILKVFAGRISEKRDRERFIRMVKENSSYSPEDKLLRPKA